MVVDEAGADVEAAVVMVEILGVDCTRARATAGGEAAKTDVVVVCEATVARDPSPSTNRVGVSQGNVP